MKRQIIKIDETKCNGCGICAEKCFEGAIQIIDGKARLISDLFCDGLGACIGDCPLGAIEIEERESQPYSERTTLEKNIIPKGRDTVIAHLKHLKSHREIKLFNEAVKVLREYDIHIDNSELKDVDIMPCGCPGTMAKVIEKEAVVVEDSEKKFDRPSRLRQWPVQLHLINPNAAYLDNADLLIAADCTAFSHGDFHEKFITGRITIIFCPKLDKEINEYIDKLAEIFKYKNIKSITVVRMEVPCCGGTEIIVNKALEQANVCIPIKTEIIKIK